MILRDLRAALGRLSHLHELTPTDIDDIRADSQGVTAVIDTHQWESAVEEARDNETRMAADLKECEAERSELEDRANELEALIEEQKTDGPEQLKHAREESARFRTAAIAWSQEVAAMREELRAIRSRKGVTAGVCAYSHDIFTLLSYVSQTDGRYREDARKLLGKINLL